MRNLSDTLLAAQKQKSGIKGLAKIVLTYTGQTTQTFTRSRILDIDHREEPFSQKATVLLQNADGTLDALDLTGYKGVISYGATTSAGDEYSACAPLYVVPQTTISGQSKKQFLLQLQGIPDELDEDLASALYVPNPTDTIKTIINGILGATIASYSHCTAYTVDWDSEDSLIDTYCPKQNFRIFENMSRLSSVYQLLSATGCLMRVEADEHIHIIVPKISGQAWTANTAYVAHDYVRPTTPNNNFTYECTTAGTSHATTEPTWPTTAGGTVSDGTVTWTARAPDYSYSMTSGEHNFFEKHWRTRIVVPNYVTVNSYVGDSPVYTGYATDASYSKRRKDQFFRARLASSAQATAIAEAMVAQARIARPQGFGKVPLNVGAEALDYVKITDANQGDTRLGSAGYIHRKVNFNAGKWDMSFGFGGWDAKQSLSKSLVPGILGWEIGDGAITNVALSIVTNVGDSLIHSADTQGNITQTTYTKVREIFIPCYGYLRIKFDLLSTDPEADLVYGRIYRSRNGASTAIGTQRSTGAGSWVTYSEDLYQWQPGDLLQLYVKKADSGTDTGNFRNLRIYIDNTGQVSPYTPAFVDIL